MKAEKEFIFGEVKPTENCHASTVLPLPGGDILAAWFGGTREGCDDVDIWVARRSGGVWHPAARVSAARDMPHWNPVLFLRRDGAVRLFFKVGKKVRYWRTWFCDSADGGRTFGEPMELVPGDTGNGRGPVKNKCLRLSDDRVLAPASSETGGMWKCFIDTSFDDGDTWTRGRDVPAREPHSKTIPMIQPTLWESEPGRVHMLTRTAAGRIYRSDSEDFGASWCMAYPTAIPNNNSGIDLARAADGALYLACNPVAENWGPRTPLVLLQSADNGVSWSVGTVLEDEEGEYSYPAVVERDGTLHITYTWRRERVAYRSVML